MKKRRVDGEGASNAVPHFFQDAKPLLFTYVIRDDFGSAPNPYGGVCSLVICKPAIRKAAKVGDWIVGTGSTQSPKGNMSGKAVYIMKVTQKMTMQEYDKYTQDFLPVKIPQYESQNVKEKAGDSIYDYSGEQVIQRKSVHGAKNIKTDLGGQYALLSTEFYYFGENAVPLPPDLAPIVIRKQGHQAQANAEYFEKFLEWLRVLNIEPNKLYGKPQNCLDEGGQFNEVLTEFPQPKQQAGLLP